MKKGVRKGRLRDRHSRTKENKKIEEIRKRQDTWTHGHEIDECCRAKAIPPSLPPVYFYYFYTGEQRLLSTLRA
jgi:hypothetical protein